MQRLRRIVLYSLGVLALIVVLLLAAPLFVDVNDFKPIIVQKLEEASGRTVAIGRIRASLFPWVGLSLSEVSIGNPRGFSEAPMLAVKEVDVRLALLPLLRRQVQIKSFVLNNPRLRLERVAEGRYNWQQPVAKASQSARERQTSTDASPAAPLGIAVTAETMRVKDGVIQWQDATNNAAIELRDVNLAVDQLSLDRPIRLRLTAKIGSGSLRLDAHMGPLGDLSAIKATTLPLQVHIKGEALALGMFKPYLPDPLSTWADAMLAVDGQMEQRPNGLRLSAGEATLARDLAYSARWRLEMPKPERLELRDLELAVNDQPLLRINGTMRRLLTRPSFQLNVQSSELKREVLSEWVPALHDIYDQHPQPWRRLKLAVLASGDAQRVEVRDLQLMLDDDLLHSSGRLEFGGKPRLRLRLAAKSLHLDPWLPQQARSDSSSAAAATPTGSSDETGGASIRPKQAPAQDPLVQPQASASPPQTDGQKIAATESGPREPDLRFLRDWRIDASGLIESAVWHGLAMRQVRFNLIGGKGVLRLDPLQFEVAGGRLIETASLSVGSMPASWREAVNIRGVRLAPLLAAFGAGDFLDGTLEMQTELSGRGLLPATALAGLSGRGQVLVRNGRIKGIDIPGTLRRLRHLGRDTGPKATDFTELSGSFNIRNGVAHNDDLFMASPLFRLTGAGDVDLAGKTLDFHIKPRLVGTLVGQGDTVAVRKGLSVPLHIKGPFDALKVEPEVDLNTLMENVDVIHDALQGGKGMEAGKAIEQEIRKSLKNILPGVLGP